MQVFLILDICRIQSLNTENLDWLMSHDNVPVIGCIGENPEGRLGLVQADDGTHTLSTYTQPLKVLLLNAGGGISDSSGEVSEMLVNCFIN